MRTAAVIVVFAASPSPAQTRAGTSVSNVATARDAGGQTISSNAARFMVAERLDCALARGDAGAPTALLVLLTNPGNGSEAFVVAATGATSLPVAVDDDGDGRLDPARDHLLNGGITPELAPGATLRLLIPVDDTATSVIVTARGVTGSGAPGSVFAGLGDGGGDAVVGATGAAARLTIALAADIAPTIVESQSVLASDGSNAARRGSVVTYTIDTRFVSASPAARVVNPIPANTRYQPATLTLDGAALADADHVASGQIVVPLGAVAAGAAHRITFKAIIQ